MAVMELNYYILFGVALTGYALIKIIFAYQLSRRRAAFAAKKGCKRPPVYKSRLPLGVDFIQEALQADKEGKFCELLRGRFDQMGNTYEANLLGTQVYQTRDPENVKALLATQFQDFDLGPTRRGNFMPLLGNGIFTQDGKPWEHSRAMMRPQFAREQVSDLELEERHVQSMMRALPVDAEGWTSKVDLQVLFFRLTLDTATEFMFGESVESQLAALPEHNPSQSQGIAKKVDEKVFAKAFDDGQAFLATRIRFQDSYWLVDSLGFRKTCRQVHDFIDHYVRLALDHNPASKAEKGGLTTASTSGKEKYVFLEALAAHTRDPIELRSQLLNILLAGRDTTASLLGWTFLLLSRDPTTYARLRKIILADFGTYKHPHDISFARLKACTYLQHVLNETLRLYPVVPVNGRQANKDTTIPRGGGPDGLSPIFVKKNQRVDYVVHSMHRRADIWGPDVDEFRPERWEGRRVGWEFLPFNGGPRICLGQQFALTEVGYVLVRLLQRFEECADEGVAGVRQNLTLTTCSGNGVFVRLGEARE